MIRVHEVDTDDPRQVRRFLEFPFQLYRDCPQWVPPMAGDARLQLDRRQHPFYHHSDAAFFLAIADGATVGRIAVLEHRRHSRSPQNGPRRDAFFYLFDSADDQAVTQALFDAAEEWASRRGLTHVVGPLGFAPGDSIGLLVEGFEHRAAMGIGYNHPYYPILVEGCGYRKEFDLVSCHLTDRMEFPDKIHRVAERVKERRGFRVVSFRSKRELRAIAPKIKRVYNETLGTFEGNTRLTEAELDAVARRMIAVAEPELIKVVMRGDDLVGFLFAFPDLSAAIQRCRGRLWPLGWFWLLREYRRTRWVDLNGIAVVPKYQGLGASLVLYSEMAKTLQTGRFTDADLVQVREDNAKMIAELERLGATVYKRHRVYRKPV